MRLMLEVNAMPDTSFFTQATISGVVVLVLISGTLVAAPTALLGATEEREKHAPRSSVYKGEVVVHGTTTLIMKDTNGQQVELQLGPDTVIQGRRGAPFRPGDLIEADVTPEGHAKSIRPVR
jgi:hypothetical protein